MQNVNNSDFERFWADFPRKEAKKDAMKAWSQMTEEQKFTACASIPLHVRFWNLSGRERHYIPLCATWLRGERWSDELEMPQKKSADDWWRSTAGIEAKARELGMWPPRAGEDWHSLKARLMAKSA